MEPLYNGHPVGNEIFVFGGGGVAALSQGLICTKRVHLGLSKVAFIEGCPHVRGEGFHYMHAQKSPIFSRQSMNFGT